MAINIKVNPYCENCMEFEADQRFETIYSTDILIQCKHRVKCSNIYRYLKYKEKENEHT